jgi:hypothetical protein
LEAKIIRLVERALQYVALVFNAARWTSLAAMIIDMALAAV